MVGQTQAEVTEDEFVYYRFGRVQCGHKLARERGFYPAGLVCQCMEGFRERDTVLLRVLHQSVVATAPLGTPPHLVEVVEPGLEAIILVTVGPYALEAAKNATATIPIVFAGVGANFAPARSGANLTGVAEEIIASTVKRLALLKEAVPSLTRVAILANPNNYGTQAYVQQCRAWAQAAGVTLQVYEVREPDDIAPAFAKMISEHAEGLIAFTDSIIFGQREQIVQTALKNGLPGSYPYREWVTAGGLLSYGPNLATILVGSVPMMIDKILKGAKPSDLPVEQPKSEVFINLKTAQALGLTIPPTLLFQANEVIR